MEQNQLLLPLPLLLTLPLASFLSLHFFKKEDKLFCLSHCIWHQFIIRTYPIPYIMPKFVPEVGCYLNTKLKCMAQGRLNTWSTNSRLENWWLCCGNTFGEIVTSDYLDDSWCVYLVCTSRGVVGMTAKRNWLLFAALARNCKRVANKGMICS